MSRFDLVKVFSATKARERVALGERVTEWLAEQRGKVVVVDKVVSQSSDNEFHCLTITLFCSNWKSRPEDSQGRRERSHSQNG